MSFQLDCRLCCCSHGDRMYTAVSMVLYRESLQVDFITTATLLLSVVYWHLSDGGTLVLQVNFQSTTAERSLIGWLCLNMGLLLIQSPTFEMAGQGFE